MVCTYANFPCRRTRIFQQFSIFTSTYCTYGFFRIGGSTAGTIFCFRGITARPLTAMGMRPVSGTLPCPVFMPFGGNFCIRYFLFPVRIGKQLITYVTAPVFYVSVCKTACFPPFMVSQRMCFHSNYNISVCNFCLSVLI